MGRPSRRRGRCVPRGARRRFNIISTLITASTSDDPFNLDTVAGANDTTSTGTELAGTLLTTTLGLVLTTLAAAACFRAVSAVYLGEQPTVSESLGYAAQRLLPLIWLGILYGVGLIPAFILLVIPGIWLAVAWSLSYPALLHEGLGATGALGRSFKLVRGRWWPTFGALFVMYLIVAVISAIILASSARRCSPPRTTRRWERSCTRSSTRSPR